MKRAFAVAVCLALGASAALAQEVSVHPGTYYGGSPKADMTIDIAPATGGAYAISIDTARASEGDFGGCAGNVSGEATFTDNQASLLVPNPDNASQTCEISLKFDDNGFLVVEEKEGCDAFRGAACTFTGELVHEGAAG